ncbi:MAG: contractile injection system tape measure protein [Ginsengibacter sp.]
MVVAKNIIRSQTIDVQYNGNAEGFALQEQLGSWCKETFLPALEIMLEEYARDDNYIKIEKIEIETSAIGVGDWQHILLKNIIEKIKDKINSATNNAQPDFQAKHNTAETNFRELLFHFLQYGYFPWWSNIDSKNDFNNQLEECLEKGSIPRAEILILLNNQDVRKRIAYQFTPKAFAHLIAGLTKSSLQKAEAIMNDVIVIIGSRFLTAANTNISENNFREILLNDLLISPAKNVLIISIETWLQQAIAYNSFQTEIFKNIKLHSEEFKAIVKKIKEKQQGIIEGETRKKKQPGKKSLDDINLKVEEATKAETAPEHEEEINPVTIEKQDPEEVIKDKETTNINKDKPDLPSKPLDKMLLEGIYISNAGLVLLAPFLPRFFENLGIVEKGRFNSKDLAVAMLQWLVTGKDDYAEFELVLPKILCGIQPEESVIIIPRLPETFKTEGEGLLRSVIEHWSILKNTSIEGLRESFLQRGGKLSMKREEWFLQVEQKPYDMLLEHLPWNISMIRLSWMEWLLRTEWIGQ